MKRVSISGDWVNKESGSIVVANTLENVADDTRARSRVVVIWKRPGLGGGRHDTEVRVAKV